MQTISLTAWSDFTTLEKTFYEKASYENLLSYMSSSQIGNSQEYFQEYQGVIKTYNRLCQKLEQEVILPIVGDATCTWEVDFIDQCVKIRTETD